MSKLFSIGLEVEEVAVGRVLRQLDGMAGVAKINLNLTSQKRSEIADEAEVEPVRALAAPIRPYKPRSGNVPERGRCDQAIADALQGGELHLNKIATFIQRRGFSPVSVSAIISSMNRRGLVKRVSEGTWALAPAGHKHFFKDKATQPPPWTASKPVSGRGTSNRLKGLGANNSMGIRRIMLDLLRNGPKTSADVGKALIENGKSIKSITGPVYDMRLQQPPLIAKSKDGVYSITPHGKAEIERIAQAEQSMQSPQSQAAE